MNYLKDVEIKKISADFLGRSKKLAIVTSGVILSFWAYITVSIYLKRRKYRHIPGPPTKGIKGFYLGHLDEILEAINNGKVIVDVLNKWHGIYGEVFKYQLGSKITVVITESNAIKKALITKNFPKVAETYKIISFPFGARFLGVGLVTDMNYERWKKRRAIFNSGFHRRVLVTFVSQFNQIVDRLSDTLQACADGKTLICLGNQINRATLDAIALIAFGMQTNSLGENNSVLNIYLSKTMQIMLKIYTDPLMKFKPSSRGIIKELRYMLDYIRKVGRDKILERLSAYNNNEHTSDDILSSILASYKGGDLDIEAMTDDFVTFFVAGQETTANTLAFVFLELGRRPDLVVKAREEIDRILGVRTNVTFQDFNDLKYCSAIFKEALRLYPPAMTYERFSTEVMDVNGYEIPEKTILTFSSYVNARYEKYFSNAYEFKPERFIKTQERIDSGIDKYVYMPFSLGPRNCIGQNFAHLEAVTVIAKLLQKFDFKLDPTQSLDVDASLTLKPKDGTRVYVSLRT